MLCNNSNLCSVCDVGFFWLQAVDIDWPPKIDPVPCLEETKVEKNYAIEDHTEL